jgi:hypothetical protein
MTPSERQALDVAGLVAAIRKALDGPMGCTSHIVHGQCIEWLRAAADAIEALGQVLVEAKTVLQSCADFLAPLEQANPRSPITPLMNRIAAIIGERVTVPLHPEHRSSQRCGCGHLLIEHATPRPHGSAWTVKNCGQCGCHRYEPNEQTERANAADGTQDTIVALRALLTRCGDALNLLFWLPPEKERVIRESRDRLLVDIDVALGRR